MKTIIIAFSVLLLSCGSKEFTKPQKTGDNYNEPSVLGGSYPTETSSIIRFLNSNRYRYLKIQSPIKSFYDFNVLQTIDLEDDEIRDTPKRHFQLSMGSGPSVIVEESIKENIVLEKYRTLVMKLLSKVDNPPAEKHSGESAINFEAELQVEDTRIILKNIIFTRIFGISIDQLGSDKAITESFARELLVNEIGYMTAATTFSENEVFETGLFITGDFVSSARYASGEISPMIKNNDLEPGKLELGL